MKPTRVKYLLFLLFFLAANIYILIQRNNGYKYLPYKTYTEIYVTDSTLYLERVDFSGENLELCFSLTPPSAKYKLAVDGSKLNQIVKKSGKMIRIPLQKGIHQYKMLPTDNKGAAIEVQADHHTIAQQQYINEFLYCNLPGPQIKVSPYNIWTKGNNFFSSAEQAGGEAILRKNTYAFSAATDSAKLMEVCKFLSALRPNPKGISPGVVATYSPYEQLKLAMQHSVDLECGNYSAMLYFLCCVLHLPNRVITFRGAGENWRYGVHYFNEVYLREKQQWVLCDALNEIYLLHDSTRYYNAADINKMAKTNSFQNKYVYTFQHDSLKKEPYDKVNYPHLYYNRSNANLCFLHSGANLQGTRWHYLKEFYTFKRDYYLYSDINRNDWMKIMLKMAAFYLFIICIFLYVLFEIKVFRQKKCFNEKLGGV